MEKIDIRKIKTELRNQFKDRRRKMTYINKAEKDFFIFNRIISTKEFINSDLVLTFVSTDIEVNTRSIINYALNQGKKVGVPKCFPDSHMEFYYINSIDELSPGCFSVLEPNIDDNNNIVLDFSSSVCVVPGLGFDMEGYRLGYGKGYYDRYLSRYTNNMIGICYASCLKSTLPHGRYDRKINILITDKFTKRFS